MPARILIATSSRKRGKSLAKALGKVKLPTDMFVGAERPESWDDYRLVICEVGPKSLAPKMVLEHLPRSSHVVLLTEGPSVGKLGEQMDDPRVNHLVAKAWDIGQLWQLRHIALKLATGDIFGFDRYLPSEWDIGYRRIGTYDDRCQALSQLSSFAERHGFGPGVRRACTQVVRGLLVNAMYDAPVDDRGIRIFADDAGPSSLQEPAPEKVSLRQAAHEKNLLVAVRDRFGTLRRKDLLRGIRQKPASEEAIEAADAAASHGFYMAASKASMMMVNVLPGQVCEVICVFTKGAQGGLQLFSFAAHPEVISKSDATVDPGGMFPGVPASFWTG